MDSFNNIKTFLDDLRVSYNEIDEIDDKYTILEMYPFRIKYYKKYNSYKIQKEHNGWQMKTLISRVVNINKVKAILLYSFHELSTKDIYYRISSTINPDKHCNNIEYIYFEVRKFIAMYENSTNKKHEFKYPPDLFNVIMSMKDRSVDTNELHPIHWNPIEARRYFLNMFDEHPEMIVIDSEHQDILDKILK